MNQAKQEAERRGLPLTALIEEGLRLVLVQSHVQPRADTSPFRSARQAAVFPALT